VYSVRTSIASSSDLALASLSKNAAPSLKSSLGVVGLRCRNRLNVLSEVAGRSHNYFVLPLEVMLILFDAVHDNLCGSTWRLGWFGVGQAVGLHRRKPQAGRATRRSGRAALELRGKGRRSRRKAFTPALPSSISLAAACGGGQSVPLIILWCNGR